MTLLLIRYGLAAVLAMAVLGKARRFEAFRGSLGTYGLHGSLAWAGAFAIIVVEALAAALALSPAGTLPVGVVGTVLGTIFTGLQVHLLTSGNRAPCLCFGTEAPVSATSLARAAVVLLAGLVLLLAA